MTSFGIFENRSFQINMKNLTSNSLAHGLCSVALGNCIGIFILYVVTGRDLEKFESHALGTLLGVGIFYAVGMTFFYMKKRKLED